MDFTLIKYFNNFKSANKDVIERYTNYLFVLYAFFIPISGEVTRGIFSVIIISLFFNSNIILKIKDAFKNKFIISIFLYYFIQIIYLYLSTDVSHAIANIKSSRHMLYVLIYIILIRKEYVYIILTAFLYSMMFSEIVSYLIFFQIIDTFNNATIDNPVPFVLSHTQYAVYLSLSVGIMLFMTLDQYKSKIMRVIYFIFFITATSNIFLISSRLGFLLYVFIIGSVFIYKYRKVCFKILPFFIVFAIFSYYCAYTFSNTFNSRIIQTVKNTNSLINDKNFKTSLGIRIGHYYYSIDIIKENFFFGVGDRTQIELVKNNIIENEKDAGNRRALLSLLPGGVHSELLDVLLKFGFFGLLIYLNIYYQLYKSQTESQTFRLIQYLLIISFMFSALQGSTFVLKDLGKLFTLLAVLTILSKDIKLKLT